MKRQRIAAFFLAVATVASVLSLSVSAAYPMTCTVYYKDTFGRQLSPSVTVTTDAANPSLRVPSPVMEGYILQNSEDAIVTYEKMDLYFPPSNYDRSGTATYTVVYAKAYTVTVHYVSSDGISMFADKTFTGKTGDSYAIPSPTDTGYSPDRTSISGTVKGYDQDFTVTYYPKTYTVSYDANGGTGAPAVQLKTSGKNLILSMQKPTKAEDQFLGWSTSSSSSSIAYQPGDTYSANASVTLYAVWAGGNFTVTYNAAGGSGAPAPQIKQYGIPLALSDQVPKRSGYVFLGWGTDIHSALYQPGDTYTFNRDLTLYAVWGTSASYIISYDANGGSNAPAGQTKIAGIPLTLSDQIPTRTGYVFLGWAESRTASTAAYRAGGTFTKNQYTTLYAVWHKNTGGSGKTYRITYMANGGNFAPAAQTQKEGWAVQITAGVPRRDGYRFLGWSENSRATVASYHAGDYYMPNRNVFLYAVWEKRPSYYVFYDANGGIGAPEKQEKIYNVNLLLASEKPTKEGSAFLGWATDPQAREAEYMPGDRYTENASVILYAIWQNDHYDFAVSGMTVTPDPVYQYDQAIVRISAENMDPYHSYTNIPVAIYLNNRLVHSTTVNFAAGSVNHVIFTLSVGALEGRQSLNVRINWAHRNEEVSAENNTKSVGFEVEKRIQIEVHPVSPNGAYFAGYEVISSFMVSSTTEILPDENLCFELEVYTVQGESETRILTRTKCGIVVPANGENLVWFRWNIPVGMEGTLLLCRGTVNGQGVGSASGFFTETVQGMLSSQTPNTVYAGKAPEGDNGKISAPEESAGSATWNQWEYIEGEFVLRQYGIEVSGSPKLMPNSSSAIYADGVWEMKSGYGVSLTWAPTLSQLSGFLMPDEDAYTGIQAALAVFPEYAYSLAEGEYRVLECEGEGVRFAENPDAAGERIHFIPIYVADGDYIVSVAASQIWTPAGMITAKRNCYVRIHGSVYDDFYIGLS